MSETSHGVATLGRLGAQIRAASNARKNELITILRAGWGAVPLNVREAARPSAFVRGAALHLADMPVEAMQQDRRRFSAGAASTFLVTSPALVTTRKWASVRGKQA